MKINYKKIFIYLLKLLSSLLFSFLIFELLTGFYSITNISINIFILGLFLIFLLLCVNWIIWTNGILKKIVMFLILCLLLISGILWAFDYLNLKSDYCLEDGDCKEGRIIFVNDKEILLNKNTCTLHNWEWHEKSKTCKIQTGTFRVKNVIYD